MADWRENYTRYRSIFLHLIDSYRKKASVKTFLELLLTLSTITIFTIFALKPTASAIIDLTKEIKTKKEIIAKMDTKIKNLVEAQKTLSSERGKLQILNSAIPSKPYPAKAIGQFSGLSSKKGLVLKTAFIDETFLKGGQKKKKSSSKDEEKLPENIDSFSLSLGFEGEFQQLVEILKTIENMRRPIKLDSVSLIKKKNKDGISNVVDLNITGRIPFLKTTNIDKNNEK